MAYGYIVDPLLNYLHAEEKRNRETTVSNRQKIEELKRHAQECEQRAVALKRLIECVQQMEGDRHSVFTPVHRSIRDDEFQPNPEGEIGSRTIREPQ